MSKKAQRMSFSLCGETCPALEGEVYGAYQEICKKLNLDEGSREIVFELLVENYIERFKVVGTYLLRDALNTACETVVELEDRIDELEYELRNS